jgi:hypothetical protein
VSLEAARNRRKWQHSEWLKLCRERYWIRKTILDTYCRTCLRSLDDCSSCIFKNEIINYECPACLYFEFCSDCIVARDCKSYYTSVPEDDLDEDLELE